MDASQARADFERQGYLVAPALFTPNEVKTLLDHYMGMHARGGDGFADAPADATKADPLGLYPRLMHPHRGDKKSMDFLLEPRLNSLLTEILGREPYAVQTMVYYKPPGARGQALHQDQRYLRVEPGTCIAAWLALDDTDDENGCLQVVPGTQNLDLLCPIKSDTSQSFTDETVDVPEGYEVVSVPMNAGDVIFFNGSLIHGSLPNRSKDRFRRVVVGHYIAGEAQKVAHWYFPAYRMDGSVVELEVNEGGSKCGEYVAGEYVETSTVDEALARH